MDRKSGVQTVKGVERRSSCMDEIRQSNIPDHGVETRCADPTSVAQSWEKRPEWKVS